MNMKKKIFIIGCIFFIIVATCFVFIKSLQSQTYTSAKTKCEKILNSNRIEMEKIAIYALQNGNNTSGEFNGYFYICYKDEGFVKFEIDGQGMLGGQYWDLVYTVDGTLYGETSSYSHEEANGNNVVKAEKLDGHWWYHWTDYDKTDKSYK